MGFEIIVFLVIVAAVVAFIVISTNNARKNNDGSSSNKAGSSEAIVDEGGHEKLERTIFSKDSEKERLAADAYDTSNPEYLYINDMGVNVYARSFYIEQLPLNVIFATTFRGVFQYRDLIASVPIVPLDIGKATEAINKNIKKDEAEIIDAQKRIDTSRVAEMQKTLQTHLKWLEDLRSGQEAFFEMAFLFTLTADSLDNLNFKTKEFVALARKTGIELCSCFGWQDLAYQANAPYNTMASEKQSGSLFNRLPIKWHIMDESAAATIYNHTNSHFSHNSGIMAGHNIDTGEIINVDFYSPTHHGYSIAVEGMPGSGKSLMCKVYVARLAPFGYRFACIDTDRSNGRGEYSGVCDAVGGVNYELRSNSPNRLNIFEIDEQLEYDRALQRYYRALRIADKATEIYYIIQYIIQYRKTPPDALTANSIEQIVKACVMGVYHDRGIEDGEADTLYADDTGFVDGVVGSGRKRKELPTMSDAFLWILRAQRKNKEPLDAVAYHILKGVFADLVDELYYDEETLERATREDYDNQEFSGRSIIRVRGTRGYFDGQSTIAISKDIPFVNIDISDLPDKDKVLGQQVAMSFLEEHFIKKNSIGNIKRGNESFNRLVVICDEAHRMFDVYESRKFLSDQVRTARKNNVSMWIITQNYSDYHKYGETKDILDDVAMHFMFKQAPAARELISSQTVLTNAAVSRVLKLGEDSNDPNDKSHKGEVCMIDGDNVVFMKVDYLRETEAVFAETDVSVLRSMK